MCTKICSELTYCLGAVFLLDPPEEWLIPSKKYLVARDFDQTEVSFLPWSIRAGGECYVESDRRAMRQGDS